MEAMIALPNGSIAKVSVYRNGDTVTVVGLAKHQTPMGTSETVVQSRMTVETFEWYREQGVARIAAARGTLAYGRLLGMVGLTDKDVQSAVNFDINRAPALPMNTIQPKKLRG